jgi:hypothetical protein
MRRYSNPPNKVSDLGELLAPSTHRNTIETENQPAAQRQRRLGQQDVALLVADYVGGASVEELILAYSVNRTTVYAHLDRNGIQRPRGVGRLSAEQVHHAGGLLKRGQGVPAIAIKLGVGEETVRRALRRAGVQPRRG